MLVPLQLFAKPLWNYFYINEAFQKKSFYRKHRSDLSVQVHFQDVTSLQIVSQAFTGEITKSSLLIQYTTHSSADPTAAIWLLFISKFNCTLCVTKYISLVMHVYWDPAERERTYNWFIFTYPILFAVQFFFGGELFDFTPFKKRILTSSFGNLRNYYCLYYPSITPFFQNTLLACSDIFELQILALCYIYICIYF